TDLNFTPQPIAAANPYPVHADYPPPRGSSAGTVAFPRRHACRPMAGFYCTPVAASSTPHRPAHRAYFSASRSSAAGRGSVPPPSRARFWSFRFSRFSLSATPSRCCLATASSCPAVDSNGGCLCFLDMSRTLILEPSRPPPACQGGAAQKREKSAHAAARRGL